MTDFRDRALGAFIGLAVGDALGAPLEFSERDSLPEVRGYRAGGPFNLRAGEWTDDTACALALAHSLIETEGALNRLNFLEHLRRWYRDGAYSSNGRCFDIGNQTRKAIEYYEHNRWLLDTDKTALGNGGLMRLAPVLLVAKDEYSCKQMAFLQSTTTHPSSGASGYANSLGHVLWQESHGHRTVDHPGFTRTRDKVRSTGHVQDTFEAANWCVNHTKNFRDAVLLAANLGDDSDTVAAVTGQWAGARYGLSGIPKELRGGLLDYEGLLAMGERLLALPR